jgi:hypothetical protein
MSERDLIRESGLDNPSNSDDPLVGSVSPRVVLKFHDELASMLPYEDDAEQHIRALSREQSGLLDRLLRDFPNSVFNRLFTEDTPEKIMSLVERAGQLDPESTPPNLLTFFVVEHPPDQVVDHQALAGALSSWPTVEAAYVDPGHGVPPTLCVNPDNNPLFRAQRYLNPGTEGIDAMYAWNHDGACGEGIKIADVEQGWRFDHEDLLLDPTTTLIHGVSRAYVSHGTCVLGILRGLDNNKGVIGIVPKAKVLVASEWPDVKATARKTATAILHAGYALDPGDILLLETQTDDARPIEVQYAEFKAIRLAILAGVVVVEAAGNKGENLDTYVDPTTGKKILNRTSPDFRDSGAIMVAAANSSTCPHHGPLTFGGSILTNYGSRIDCYAWGERVTTTSSLAIAPTSGYVFNFGATSSAAPIVAGAAAVVQGIKQYRWGSRCNPSGLRDILSNPATGTPSNNPNADLIGVMPDLKKIIDSF